MVSRLTDKGSVCGAFALAFSGLCCRGYLMEGKCVVMMYSLYPAFRYLFTDFYVDGRIFASTLGSAKENEKRKMIGVCMLFSLSRYNCGTFFFFLTDRFRFLIPSYSETRFRRWRSAWLCTARQAPLPQGEHPLTF